MPGRVSLGAQHPIQPLRCQGADHTIVEHPGGMHHRTERMSSALPTPSSAFSWSRSETSHATILTWAPKDSSFACQLRCTLGSEVPATGQRANDPRRDGSPDGVPAERPAPPVPPVIKTVPQNRRVEPRGTARCPHTSPHSRIALRSRPRRPHAKPRSEYHALPHRQLRFTRARALPSTAQSIMLIDIDQNEPLRILHAARNAPNPTRGLSQTRADPLHEPTATAPLVTSIRRAAEKRSSESQACTTAQYPARRLIIALHRRTAIAGETYAREPPVPTCVQSKSTIPGSAPPHPGPHPGPSDPRYTSASVPSPTQRLGQQRALPQIQHHQHHPRPPAAERQRAHPNPS